MPDGPACGRRCTDTGRQADVMFNACLPLGPWMISNATFWPSFRVLKPFIWMDEKCANRSSPPSSGVMKPNPFASLNHLTVPVDLGLSPWTAVAVVSDMRTASLNRMFDRRHWAWACLPSGFRVGLHAAKDPRMRG